MSLKNLSLIEIRSIETFLFDLLLTQLVDLKIKKRFLSHFTLCAALFDVYFLFNIRLFLLTFFVVFTVIENAKQQKWNNSVKSQIKLKKWKCIKNNKNDFIYFLKRKQKILKFIISKIIIMKVSTGNSK